ncbi:aspartic proteinase-like protein 1 [Planoprotostelium fungivorum]|uniref:Aspartic proteinase-like protein 1 n=1 Tax=Planoprotostelium fungivorum TaxID=1890364 RepID=A0A2P6N7Z3_9EUKA|nr:aspartic proteinase-like protein 1 [Planoprotostelium fungivorum]
MTHTSGPLITIAVAWIECIALRGEIHRSAVFTGRYLMCRLLFCIILSSTIFCDVSGDEVSRLEIGANPLVPITRSIQITGGVNTNDYYITLGLGSPEQKFVMLVDTGTYYTAVVSRDCHIVKGAGDMNQEQCRHTKENEGYDRNASWSHDMLNPLKYPETCNQTKCKTPCCWDQTNNNTGLPMKDTLRLGTTEATGHFVLITEESVEDRTTVGAVLSSQSMDGVLALGPTPDGDGRTVMPGIIQSFFSNNLWMDQTFSLCFGEQDGFLILGRDDQEKYHTEKSMDYAPLLDPSPIEGTYAVNVWGMSFGKNAKSEETDTPFFATIDSGSDGIWLPDPLYRQYVRELESICKDGGPKLLCSNTSTSCMLVKEEEISILPPLTFVFETVEGIRFNKTINGRQYVHYFPVSSFKYNYCAKLMIGLSHNESHVVLGDNWMTGFYTKFDLKNGLIGFGRPINYVPKNHGLAILLTLIGVAMLVVISFVLVKYRRQRMTFWRGPPRPRSSLDFSSEDEDETGSPIFLFDSVDRDSEQKRMSKQERQSLIAKSDRRSDRKSERKSERKSFMK